MNAVGPDGPLPEASTLWRGVRPVFNAQYKPYHSSIEGGFRAPVAMRIRALPRFREVSTADVREGMILFPILLCSEFLLSGVLPVKQSSLLNENSPGGAGAIE